MTHNKLYRNFIILQGDEKKHIDSGDKALSGYAKIEAKSDKCRISFYAQNLNEAKQYFIVLICYKKEIKQIVDLGSLIISKGGKGDIVKEYYINNIAGMDFSYDKISGAAVCCYENDKIDYVMYGFKNGENVKDDWKKCKLIKAKNDNDEIIGIKVKEEKEYKDCKEKECKHDEEDKHHDKEKEYKHDEEDKHHDKEKECEHDEEDKHHDKEKECEHDEEDKHHDKEKECKHDEEDKHHDKEEKHKHDVKEKDNDEHDKNTDDIKVNVYNKHCEKNDDHDCKDYCRSYDDKFIVDYDKYESSIEEQKDVDPYDFELRGSIGDYFKNIVTGFDEIKNKFKDIRYCKWYLVNIRSIDDLCNTSDYNRYTVIFNPMINYYPYIKKYGHFLVGYKCDSKGNIKYIVYGIPGKKDKDEQPYVGKTGFVTWMPNKESDMGYWLMFYDYKKSMIVVPMK